MWRFYGLKQSQSHYLKEIDIRKNNPKLTDNYELEAKLQSCTPQQLSQYDNMMKKYYDEVDEYNAKIPSISSSQSEYQFYMNWLKDLERQEKAIENFRC